MRRRVALKNCHNIANERFFTSKSRPNIKTKTSQLKFCTVTPNLIGYRFPALNQSCFYFGPPSTKLPNIKPALLHFFLACRSRYLGWMNKHVIMATTKVKRSQQTKHLYNICTTSAQHLQHWPNIVQMLYNCFVFTGGC